MVLSASGMWGWLMLSPSSSAPVTQLKWGLQSPPGRTTGPHLCRWRVTRLAVLWGFASRSEKEDGLHEREGCPWEPGLQAGEEPVAPDAPCSCCGNPAQAAAAELRVPRGEKGQCEATERTHSQKSVARRDPSHPAGTHYPSESQHPPHGVWQPMSSQTEKENDIPYVPHGFESTRGICYCLLWFSFRATPRWNKENSIRPYEMDNHDLGCYSSVRVSSSPELPAIRALTWEKCRELISPLYPPPLCQIKHYCSGSPKGELLWDGCDRLTALQSEVPGTWNKMTWCGWSEHGLPLTSRSEGWAGQLNSKWGPRPILDALKATSGKFSGTCRGRKLQIYPCILFLLLLF